MLWDQRGIVYPLFLNQKIDVMYWPEPKSCNKPFELLLSWDFGCRGQWSSYRNSFCQSRMLTVTLWTCSFLFNVQVMILVGSYGFFDHASTSVDGWYLYIIIHYGMLQRDCGIRLVPRGGRPNPESFKTIGIYTYSKNHTNSPYVCPRMHQDCPYEGWVFIVILDCKWVNWFTSVDHISVELCH